MNKLRFEIVKNNKIFIDGIDFSKSIFIRPIIDNEDVIFNKFQGNSLAPFEEWEKCAQNSGEYLLFTSIIGIADDGGWSLCKTVHSESAISVDVIFDELRMRYIFEKEDFLNSTRETRASLDAFLKENPLYRIEPVAIVFPETY